MSFQVSDLFQNQNRLSGTGTQNTGVDGRIPVSNQNVSDVGQGGNAGGKVLGDFPPGSSFSGQVVTAEDGTVTIKLADSTMLSASLKGGISLAAGSQVTFLVNSNSNHQMTLSPLFTNLGAGLNVENALKDAGLPIDAQTSKMVYDMMEHGMSVDRDSLLGMYRQIADHPQIDGGMAVRLAQMHLAVNELNASQLEAYDNMNHQLSGGITEIAKGLQQAFSTMGEGNTENMIRLFEGIVDLLEEGGKVPEGMEEGLLKNAGQLAGELKNALLSGSAAGNLENAGGVNGEALTPGANGQPVSELLSDKELQALTDILKNAGGDKGIIDEIAKGAVSSREALKLIQDAMQGKGMSQNEQQILFKDNSDLWKELLPNAAVGKLLQNALEKNWFMRPEDVADKEKIEEFYEQLKSQTGKLSDMTSAALGKDSALSQNVNRLSQNIDFMNQLNQTFTYVQVPLKMSSQNANGDLYVYTNKKNLAARNGSVSAFLHLDMDHLGSVDVYVAMEKQRVSTNFKVRDDAVLDLIEANIDLLNERLEKRGYKLHPTVEITEKEVSVVEEMQKQMGQNTMPIAQFSFDARA